MGLLQLEWRWANVQSQGQANWCSIPSDSKDSFVLISLNLKENKCEAIFQHDNDPKHTSKVAQKYLQNKKIVVLDWPSQSPDMNPIEHGWRIVKDKIFSRIDHATKLDQVFEIAKEEWNKLDLSYFQNLIKSMPRRIEAVYQARGRHMKY